MSAAAPPERAVAAATERLRVFLDADALIAGSASTTGAAHAILQLGELGLIQLISSAQARREVERNLLAKLPAALPAFRLLSQAALTWVEDPTPEEAEPFAELAHPKDVPILAAAVRAGCESLVTFNVRDYHPAPGSILVETPGQFLRRLRSLLAELYQEPPIPPLA
jgi:predicted nucleic acid-binding protein